jgi:hypothetical protein
MANDYRRFHAQRRPWRVFPALLFLWSGLTMDVHGQEAAEVRVPPTTGGAWEIPQSLGQPSRWSGLLGVGFGMQREQVGVALGTGVSLGFFRDFYPQHYGALSVGPEAYAAQRGDALSAGARLLLRSDAFFLHGGIDQSVTDGGTHALVGVSFPVRRGGWPLPGAKLRVDWRPARAQEVVFGGTTPIGRPLAGRTRPRPVAIGLPVGRTRSQLPAVGPAAAGAVADVAQSARWLLAMNNFFWLAEPASLRLAAAEAEAREVLGDFRRRLAEREIATSASGEYADEVEHYHRALERAFGLAAGATEADAVRIGRRFADEARRVALEELLIPYNRTIGQYKDPDVLDGLVARGRARFAAWVHFNGPGPGMASEQVTAVGAAWLADFEGLRAEVAGLTADSRMNWLPLSLALRPEQHRTQEQIDSLLTLALDRRFEPGNSLLHINAPQFQLELLRTIHETESYHVLWIHDYAGINTAGETDQTAFRQATQGYLRALIRAVEAYDRTGRLPLYLIVLDLHNYELRNSRLWMDLLERPLAHRLRLPTRDSAMAHTVAALQDSLRAAVAGSARLQGEAAVLGPDWIPGLVKVHVNITNPSDLSFRAPSLLSPIGADNMMRDHRKIVIRDVREARPAEGEVILTGAGVGDHYTSPTWDDRALLLQGPAALETLERLRSTLERHGLRGERLPPPLRRLPRAADHSDQLAASEAAGADARVLTVHNRTGFGEKEATFAQTLLYDLAPAGTLIYVPNGLWTSGHWMAQLVGAALRGIHVYIVAPAGSSAPAYSFPQMSRMQELLSRLLITRELFGDVIHRAGGDLRVGVFARESGLDDISGLLAEVEAGYRANPFLRATFPLSAEVLQTLRELGERAPTEAEVELPEPTPRPPQLHQKIQLIASREVLQAFAGDAVLIDLLRDPVAEPAVSVLHPPESGALIHQARFESALRLPRRLHELERSGAVVDPVLYLLTGSMNLNVRSMALDGEVTAVVAGAWSLQSYLDFAFLSGSVTWIGGQEELHELLPPYSPLLRRIARWMQYVL